jgi:hypothetical protein
MSPAGNEFFTPTSLATFAGASLAVMVISNTVRHLTKWDSPLPCFVVSMIISLFAARILDALSGAVGVFVAIANGCLLFCSAAGLQEATVKLLIPKLAGGRKESGLGRTSWLTPWLK